MKNPEIDIELVPRDAGELQVCIKISYFNDDQTIDGLRTKYVELLLEIMLKEDLHNFIENSWDNYLYSPMTPRCLEDIKLSVISRIYDMYGDDFQKLRNLPDFLVKQEFDKLRMMKELTS